MGRASGHAVVTDHTFCTVRTRQLDPRGTASTSAHQVSGDGPIDLLWSEGWLSHVEILWEYTPFARWMEMLGRSFRVVHFDKRGIGLSDRTASADLETRLEDVRAVLDAVESDRAVLLGEGPEGGGLMATYAATFPERVYALILWHFRARAERGRCARDRAPELYRGLSSGKSGRFPRACDVSRERVSRRQPARRIVCHTWCTRL